MSKLTLPIVEINKGKYKYTLLKDFVFFSDQLKNVKFKNKYVDIWNGVIIVKEGYSWDGCSYAPDTERTLAASLVHDVLYQFRVVDRNKCDKIFYELLVLYDFNFSLLYYAGVRTFGWIFY